MSIFHFQLYFLWSLCFSMQRLIHMLIIYCAFICSTDVHPPSSIGHESGHETGADESSCLLNISNPCSPSHSHASEYDGPIRYSEPLTSPATSLLSG